MVRRDDDAPAGSQDTPDLAEGVVEPPMKGNAPKEENTMSAQASRSGSRAASAWTGARPSTAGACASISREMSIPTTNAPCRATHAPHGAEPQPISTTVRPRRSAGSPRSRASSSVSRSGHQWKVSR